MRDAAERAVALVTFGPVWLGWAVACTWTLAACAAHDAVRVGTGR